MSDDIVVTPKTGGDTPVAGYSEDKIRPIASLVGLDIHNLSDGDTKSLQAIYDYIRGDAKEMTELELLSKVRSLEQRLGLTSLGERRVDKLYRYVKLQSQIEGLEKQRDRELR